MADTNSNSNAISSDYAFAGASGMISSLINGAFALGGQALNQRYARELATLQNKYNIDMWNRQNEYNSPQAQMRRLEAAGLNPRLMLGQISSGNAAHAPEQVVPEAPHFDKAMEEFANAFNIEGLRTAIAQRRKAEAEATSAEVVAAEQKDNRAAEESLGELYEIGPDGRLQFAAPADSGADRDPNFHQRLIRARTGALSTRIYHLNKFLLDNFRTNYLLGPRGLLINSQRGLNLDRSGLLAPQIRMTRYQEKYYPWTFWINNGRNATSIIRNVVPVIP